MGDRRFATPYDWDAGSNSEEPKKKFNRDEVWLAMDSSVKKLFGDGHAKSEVRRKAVFLGSCERLFNDGISFMDLIKVSPECVEPNGQINVQAFEALLNEFEKGTTE